MRRRTHLPRLAPAIKKQIIIAIIIFAVSFVVFSLIFNVRKTYASNDMRAATLPTISSEAYSKEIGQLYGYKNEMDACFMRDSVIPLTDSRILPLDIKAYGRAIDAISYEIRSTDMERKIAETTVSDYNADDDGNINLKLELPNLIEEGVEYLFIITLTIDDEDIHYYTRILIPENCHERELLDFAMYYHECTLTGRESELGMYLETSDNANKDTLSEVTLESSDYQLGFGGLRANEVASPIVEIKDINSDYCVYEMTYRMSLDDASGKSYFIVKEYYKLRYTADRIFILDYRRNMEEILTSDNVTAIDNTINLGITSQDINYLSNETGTITCFEQAGELFEYDQNKGQLIKLYSFLDGEEDDPRCYYDSHSIKLLSIDESGDVTFAVYGYMNRGSHEGYSGINLYRYDSASQRTIEEAFASTTCSYQILRASFSDLLYMADDKYFYVMISGNLVKINLRNDTMETILEGLEKSQYAASKSGRYLAYTTEPDKADSLIILDLKNQSTYTIDAKSGEYIRPLAFMDEDLVYGLVNVSDVGKNIAGATIYPISYIYIMQIISPEHNILKEYYKDGYYVTDASLNSYTLTMERVTKTDAGYAPADIDTIKNSAGETGRAVEFAFTQDEIRGEVTILISAKPDEENPIPTLSCVDAKTHYNRDDNAITVSASGSNDEYFVYVGSQVVEAGSNAADAIKSADEQMGIVVDNSSSYIWKRGRKAYVNAFTGLHVGDKDAKADTLSKCISTMLVYEGLNVEINTYTKNGDGPVEILRSILKKYKVLDLTGCSLNEVLYYVSQGSPVLAITGPDDATLIVGYDSGSIVTYNPNTNSLTRVGLIEAEVQFAANDNVFVSYIKE